MAFLDNSGDIILDAVLTDLGRKRMAQGNFRIVKYTFGDDEVDYGLYSKNNASGSAYYDLSILQTPVLEAFTGAPANINYGLMSYARNDLLYLPVLKRNQLIDSAVNVTGGVIQLAVNTETANWITTNVSSSNYVLTAGNTSGMFVCIEQGIDSDQLTGDVPNRNSYIINTNLLDSKFEVQCDSRLVASVMGAKNRGYFRNDSQGTAQISLAPLVSSTANTLVSSLDNYNSYIVRGVNNQVTYNDVSAATNISVIKGPRGTATALNFDVKSQLKTLSTGVRDAIWSRLGRVDVKQFGATNGKCDIIDTTIYVRGATSTATLQIPLRIMRYAGA